MPRARTVPDPALQEESQRILDQMRSAVQKGEAHWFHAAMEAIRLWPLPQEKLGRRTYCYVVGGEAFDWLLLAERLLGELDGLVPDDEAEGLLFHGRPPLDLDEAEMKQLLGAKYRAHLNYVYGVRVEQALQLAVQAEVRKEHLSRVWDNGHVEDEAFTRIYGAARPSLFAEFRAAGSPAGRKASGPPRPQDPAEQAVDPHSAETLSLADLDEFTYWLFRRRVNNHDPARVASDTRKGMATLQELDALRRRGARVAAQSA